MTIRTQVPPIPYEHLVNAGIISDDWLNTLNPTRGRFITAESYLARPDADPILTKQRINAALANSGEVSLLTAGTFYVDGPLLIPSETTFVLGKNTRIKLSSATTHNLIRNRCYQSILDSGFGSCTLTWVSGDSCDVQRTGHGFAIGDYAFIYGSTLTPSNFQGVFLVTAVADANNFTVQLNRTPSVSPSGTAGLLKADANITIAGGIWDQDFPTVPIGASDSQDRSAIMLSGLANLKLRDIRVTACAHFSVQITGVLNLLVDGITSQSNATSILKVYGPSHYGEIRRVSGYSADDGVSLQTKEPAGFIQYMPAWGDIACFKIKETNIIADGNIVALFGSINEYFGGIEVDGVYGGVTSTTAGVLISPSYTTSAIDDIYIRNVRAQAPYGVAVRNNGLTGSIAKVVVSQCALNPDTYATDRNLLFTDTSMVINDYQINDINGKNSAYPSTSGFLVNFNHNGNEIKVSGGIIDFKNANGSFLQSLGNVSTISVDKLFITSNCASGIRIFGQTPTVNITNCDIGCLVAVAPQSTCALNISANRIACGANGLIRSNTTTQIKVRSGGNNWVTSSNLFSIGTTTGAFEFYGFDIPVDIGLTGVQKTVSGQFCYNVSTRGTVQPNRLAICTGTSWVQADTPTQLF